jgi:multidrug resistance efflux pump
MEGVLRSMSLVRLKWTAAALVLLVGLLGTGTTLLLRPAPAVQPAEPGTASILPLARGANREEILVNIPSQRDGVLAIVGTEIEKGEKVVPDRVFTVKIGGEAKQYRRLQVGDTVEEGQLLARVGDRLAREEVKVRKAMLEAAEAEHRAATRTQEEAEKRYEIMVQRHGRIPGGFSQEDLRAAKLSQDRYTEEATAKAARVRAAQAELHAAETMLLMHEIRSSVRGDIKAIRKHRGEAVRNLETVFVIRAGEAGPKLPPFATPEGRTRQEVPAEREGKLIFLGTEIKPGEQVLPDQVIKIEVGFLAVAIGPEEIVPPEQQLALLANPLTYRRWKLGDDLLPERVRIARETREFRRLEVGQWVEPGQLLGLVNPVLALDEVAVKLAKFDASAAERRAAMKARDEALKRWENMTAASRRAPGRFSQDDLRAGRLAYDRYVEEELARAAAVRRAKMELSVALTVLQMYEIRSCISGVIKQIYKNPGEAVKNLETVLLIQGVR